MKLQINGQAREVRADAATPLLWVLRDELNLTGTKFACGIAACGACAVLIDGQPVRSCVMPIAGMEGKSITTIEGLSNDRSHAVQRAWIEKQVPQCGYCQSGFIVAAAALLKANPKPSDSDIDAALTNICRCGTYPAMREAVHLAAELAGKDGAAK